MCLRFTLTYAGMGAVSLGFFVLEQLYWWQHGFELTWASRGAQYRYNLLLYLESPDKVVPWFYEEVNKSELDRAMRLHEDGHPLLRPPR